MNSKINKDTELDGSFREKYDFWTPAHLNWCKRSLGHVGISFDMIIFIPCWSCSRHQSLRYTLFWIINVYFMLTFWTRGDTAILTRSHKPCTAHYSCPMISRNAHDKQQKGVFIVTHNHTPSSIFTVESTRPGTLFSPSLHGRGLEWKMLISDQIKSELIRPRVSASFPIYPMSISHVSAGGRLLCWVFDSFLRSPLNSGCWNVSPP